jgi:DNA-binding Lrp family transcriptional regulator
MSGKATYGNSYEGQVWDVIKENPGATQADIRKATGLDVKTVAHAVRRLVVKGLIEGSSQVTHYTAKGKRPTEQRGANLVRSRYGRDIPPHPLDVAWSWPSTVTALKVDDSEHTCVNSGGTLRPEESEAA